VTAVVADRLVCLDTSILIKFLATDEQTADAVSVVEAAIRDGARLIAPAFAWAEVGSVLRKKLRAGLLQPDEAEALWESFLNLPIEYVDARPMRERAWAIAANDALPTLYDAAFLACIETVIATPGAQREFWTADDELVRQLGSMPSYMRRLDAQQAP
jgi:predicted nucleic acid-binding protein